MSDARQVMFESDANGVTLVTVALYSVLRNADPQRPVHLLMAHDDSFLAAGGRERIESVVARFPTASVEFANFMPLYRPLAAKMELPGTRWPPMVWGWVFAPKLFPRATGKMVYIDLDTYTTCDLQELFDLDLKAGNHLLAMVAESRRPEGRFCNVDWTTKDPALYNTGVVVMDVDAWRAEGMTEKVVDWFAAHKADVPFVEQDATNYVCQDRILRIPLKWNYNDNNLRFLKDVDLEGGTLWENLHPPREALEAMADPKIIHYMFTHKPDKYNHRPERNVFRQAMIELGLIRRRLPGENLARVIEGARYDRLYARLKRLAGVESSLGFRLSSLTRLKGGSSPNFKAVRASDGFTFLVKLLPQRSRAWVLPALAAHLDEMAGSKAVRRIFPEAAQHVAGHKIVCLEWCEGAQKRPDRLTDGELKALVADYQAFSQRLQVVTHVTNPDPYLKWRADVVRSLRGVASPLRRFLDRELPEDSLRYRPELLKTIHGDFHHGNLLFHGGELFRILDLEAFSKGYPADDWVRWIVCAEEHAPLGGVFVRRKLLKTFAKLVRLLPYSRHEWELAINGLCLRKMVDKIENGWNPLPVVNLFARFGFYRDLKRTLALAR